MSQHELTTLLEAILMASEVPLSLKEKIVLKKVIKAVEGTDLEILLKESGLLR